MITLFLLIFNKSNDLESWLNYYQNIQNSYRFLVRKMKEDAELNKKQIENLQQANSQLSLKMDNFADKKLQLLKLAEINEMDKANLNKAFRKKILN